MQLAHQIKRDFADETENITQKSGYDILKRFCDLAFAIFLLPLLLPLMGLIALLIKMDSRGPAFFIQKRIGKGGILFPCYKFRTMVKNSDFILNHILKDKDAHQEWQKDFKLKNDPRITRMGYFLRKSSLDELPQIFNVLKGEMSFVGPRPIVEDENFKYGEDFAYYQSTLPGITGLWQVSGRNDLDYPKRVWLDKKYAFKKSLFFDLKIILKTLPVVLSRRGAY